VPAEELEMFNSNLLSKIRIVKVFKGEKFKPSTKEGLTNLINSII
jgi:hypothetical protein